MTKIAEVDVHHMRGYELLPVASFTKEVNLRVAKRSLVVNGVLANRGLTTGYELCFVWLRYISLYGTCLATCLNIQGPVTICLMP